eukprot:GHUV01033980.1.p1 GENE.GHUV01033980.1~~GHUV01033980.1.p1  ORF type:complete len:127 (+),score=24.72 GHUV01033980.1:551-931(+)
MCCLDPPTADAGRKHVLTPMQHVSAGTCVIVIRMNGTLAQTHHTLQPHTPLTSMACITQVHPTHHSQDEMDGAFSSFMTRLLSSFIILLASLVLQPWLTNHRCSSISVSRGCATRVAMASYTRKAS